MREKLRELLEKSLTDLKKYFCSQCSPKSISGYMRVRSEKEIEQAITSSGLSKYAIHALQWVLFNQEEPKKKEEKAL